MMIDRSDCDERLERVDGMIAEFRAAQQRRLVRRGAAVQTSAALHDHAGAVVGPAPKAGARHTAVASVVHDDAQE